MKQTIFARSGFGVLMFMLMISLGIAGVVQAGTIYVDQNNNTGVEDGTIDNPFNTIQEGIDAANFGDTVEVQPGTYTGDLTIDGKKKTGYIRISQRENGKKRDK